MPPSNFSFNRSVQERTMVQVSQRKTYSPPAVTAFGTLSAITAQGSMGPYCDVINMAFLSTDPQGMQNMFC